MIRYPRPALLAELPPGGGVIEASAGTGKTWTLERLVVDLLLQGVPLEALLVVTFTEKATLEIATRLRRMLELLVGLRATPEGTGESAWELDEQARERLGKALRSFDRASISTIHGFCRRVLQESAFDGGALFRQQLADGRTLFGRALRDLLREGAAADLLAEAAGDGWTLDRLEGLLWQAHQEEGTLLPGPVDLEPLLRACPAELFAEGEAVAAAVRLAPGIHGSTRTAAAKRVPRLAALLAGQPTPFRFARVWDFDGLAECSAALVDGPGRALGGWLQRVRAQLPTPESILVHALLGPVRERLAARKAAEGLFDFRDMVLKVRDALRDRPALARRLADRYQAALIDEFQDTDAAQWEIFRRIFLEGGRRIFLIGDPKQGIYGFRGGDLPTYLRARAELAGAPVPLAENFRSTPAMVEAVNHLLARSDPAFFHAPNEYLAPVRCGRPGLAFRDAAGRPLAPVRSVQVRQLQGAAPAVAHALAAEIRELVEGGAWLGEAEVRDGPVRGRLRYADVQVLVAKRAQGLQVAEALAELGVPSAFYKQDGLFRGDEAQDLLDVLRAVLDPGDRGRLARALVTPFFAWPLADLEALPELGEDHPARQRLLDWRELARERAFPLLFDRLLHGSGLAARLRLCRQGDRALTNHLHLAELLCAAARERSRDLEGLVRLLGQWRDGTALPPGEEGDLQRLEAEPDAVQMLTMHQSKGLEAAVVALFGFTAGRTDTKVHRFHEEGERRLWLGDRTGPKQASIEAEIRQEEERLLYVALTRARARVLLPCFLVDDSKGAPAHPKGPYRALNPVLRAIAEGGERPDLFETVELRRAPGERPPQAPAPDLSHWSPPVLPAVAGPDYEACRRRARPRMVTSFTGLEARRNARHGEDLQRHQDRDEAGAPPGQLPGGSRTGQALHALLEELELESARAGFEAWWTAGRRAWTEGVLRRFGLGPEWAAAAARVAHQAVRTPLPDGAGGAGALLDHDPGRLLRELDFLGGYFDTPDYLAGALDVLYQRGGRTYLLDWKSNLLPGYGTGELQACVDRHYQLQVQLYTWTVLRWLHVETEAEYEAGFGGIQYVFLRGLPERGVWFHRPAWREVLAWRDGLLRIHGELVDG